MISVYAITDKGNKFLMFQTMDTYFAHSNVQDTYEKYTEKIVSYEFNGEVFPVNCDCDQYDCCNCGGYGCGCSYCFACNCCEVCSILNGHVDSE